MTPVPLTVTAVTIAQIESAINHWRERSLPVSPDIDPENLVLCAQARALADVYGMMIYCRQTSVEFSALSAQQRDALAVTL